MNPQLHCAPHPYIVMGEAYHIAIHAFSKYRRHAFSNYGLLAFSSNLLFFYHAFSKSGHAR